ncbi:MAG: hypothetical protein ACXU97_11440 [Thermodesulfobacteriota bacterium]|jgi:hypothetical protein
MTNAHEIAGAMELYGESAVSDVIARVGNYHEIVTLFDIEAGMKLLKIAKYETNDGKIFKKKEGASDSTENH